MDLFPLESSILQAYGWEAGPRKSRVGLLALQFKDGSEYWYQGVPERVFEDFLMSKSKGSFFRRELEPTYKGTPKPANE